GDDAARHARGGLCGGRTTAGPRRAEARGPAPRRPGGRGADARVPGVPAALHVRRAGRRSGGPRAAPGGAALTADRTAGWAGTRDRNTAVRGWARPGAMLHVCAAIDPHMGHESTRLYVCVPPGGAELRKRAHAYVSRRCET